MVDTESGGAIDFTTLVVTFIVGATVLVLVYISALFKTQKEKKTREADPLSTEKHPHRNEAASGVGSLKLPTKKKQHHQPEKWSRDSKQTFSHPWLLTSLKGHGGNVLDMDFSSNGKFLATCAEDDPGGDECSETSSSGSEGNKENRPQRVAGVALSRRQKKNSRVRRDDSSPGTVKRKSKVTQPHPSVLRQHIKLNLHDGDLSMYLRNYILQVDQLLELGYPVESALYPGRAIIFKAATKSKTSPCHFDVNAREFVPAGQQENSLYVSSLVENTSDWSHKAKKSPRETAVMRVQRVVTEEKQCVRCKRGFFVSSDGEYLTQEHCLYHWGKLLREVCGGLYSCCQARQSARGCTTAKLHVWNGIGLGINGPLDGYVRTRQRKTPPPDGSLGVYALDCEMCFTTRGLELTKVTVVGSDGRLVYDCLVRPENDIIDYNTRFSGIRPRDFARRSQTKSLRDVQNDLMGFINADTILIGHGLENDLRALRMIHTTVVDTAVVFPHNFGLPYRRSLKSLVMCLLKRNIQTDSTGHDSLEDARACVELMLWKVRRDFRSC